MPGKGGVRVQVDASCRFRPAGNGTPSSARPASSATSSEYPAELMITVARTSAAAVQICRETRGGRWQ